MASVIISSGISIEDAKASSAAAGLNMYARPDRKIDVYSSDVAAVEAWFKGLSSGVTAELIIHKIYPCLRDSYIKSLETLHPTVQGEPFFTAKEIAQIYTFPNPDPSVNIVIGVPSFGGGLFGTVSADGVLTNGDVQAYWTAIGIPTNQHPRVIIKTINGATNSPNNGSETFENTLDVEAIGGACASPNLTIILYITPNNGRFYNVLNYMYTTPIVVDGVSYTPNIISISWALPEQYSAETSSPSLISLFQSITEAGISIFVATGDWGAPNIRDWGGGNTGPPGNDINFPASSPYCTAVGGTTLVCANNIYDNSTQETAWADGGGGISVIYSKPSYQSTLSGIARSIPDVSALADPVTGMLIILNGSYYIIGGTSLSAPLLAAFLACINCRKYVNPLLYTAPSNCFHDITSGNIGGGVVTGPGYDQCTGRGSINGANLAIYLNGVQVTDVSLDQTSASVFVGDTIQLTATLEPTNATITEVTWSSSNTFIATVNSSGLVTAVSAGSATITVRTTDGGYTDTCAITITGTVAVSSVILNKTTATVRLGTTTQLVATVLPANATNKAVTWSSSDTSKATVNTSGLVTASATNTGSATITVTTTDGGKTATCALTVIISIPVRGVILNENTAFLAVDSTLQLRATVQPANATNNAVTWFSSNTNIATVDSSGNITPITTGTVNIVVTTDDGSFTDTCAVKIYSGAFIPVTGVGVTPTSRTIEVGGTQQLTANIIPTNATNKLVLWSSNSSSASVSQTGLVTGISPGPATITVTTRNGGRRAISSILVNSPPLITMRPQNTTVSSGEIVYIYATITRPGISALAITWSSSNTSIATVPSVGVISSSMGNTTTVKVGVTGTGNGTAIITANATLLGISGTSSVLVTTRVEGVTLNRRNISLAIGETFQAVPTITPDTATNQEVSWSSSSTRVATVDEYGLITGLRNGITSIRATSLDGGISAALTISVVTSVTGVNLSLTTLTLNRGATRRLLASITPPNASNIGVRWSSSNTRVASVSSTGIVRSITVGTATITVTTNNGGLTSTCLVTVV